MRLYGNVTALTSVTVATEGARVKMIDVLTLEDDWFLQMYRSYFVRGFLVGLLILTVAGIAAWAVSRLLSGRVSVPENE